MKLYYSPGACALAAHIALAEADFSYTIESVNLKTKITESGENFFDINPRGQVPALLLDDGSVLTQLPAILQYIADSAPSSILLAPVGDLQRYHVISCLGYESDVHHLHGPLFHSDSVEEKAAAVEKLKVCYGEIEKILSTQPYFSGDTLTIADFYLYVLLRWKRAITTPLPNYPATDSYVQRLTERTAIAKALSEEGLR